MSKPEISLETRASSAYVQGRLEQMAMNHKECVPFQPCSLAIELAAVLQEWKHAEAELAEARAELAINREKESK